MAATPVPSKIEFNRLGDDTDSERLAEVFGEVFDRRQVLWQEISSTAAACWLFAQEPYIEAGRLFRKSLRIGPRKSGREAWVSFIVSTAVRYASELEVSHRAAYMKRYFHSCITFDERCFERQVAIALSKYFWDDVERELSEVRALDEAIQKAAALRAVIDGPLLAAADLTIEFGSRNRGRSMSSGLDKIDRCLALQRKEKMPKIRRDESLRERLLLWNLRVGLRKVRRSGVDRAGVLTALMHLDGIEGQWDRRTVDKHLAKWREAEAPIHV